MIFEIRYGMGGGFGGAGDWEETECPDLETAAKEARQLAIECYQGYEGLHGIRGINEIIDEDGVEREEAEDMYWEEVDSWIDYDAREKPQT